MNQGKILTFLMTLMLNGSIFANAASGQFKVALKGNFHYLESFQKRAELKLVRSTDFCRGFTFPTRIKAWECKQIGGGEGRCAAQFKCGMIRRGFSRRSETVRLTKEIRQLSRPKTRFSLIISKEAFKKYNYNRVARQAQRLRTGKMLSSKGPNNNALREQIKVRAKRLKDEMTEMDDFSQLEQELDLATKKQNKKLKKVVSQLDTVEELESQALVADQEEIKNNDGLDGIFGEDKEVVEDDPKSIDDLDDIFGEDKEVVEDEPKSSTKQQEDEILSDNNDSSESIEGKKSSWHFLSLGMGIFSIAASEGGDVKTFGALWSPLWKISSNWSIKGNLSWHQYSATIDPTLDAEVFSIIEYGGQLEWHPMSGGLYFSGGYGIQNWGSSIKSSFSAISLGGGYYFEEKKGRLIDYIFVKKTSVSNATKNSELVAGLGFIF